MYMLQLSHNISTFKIANMTASSIDILLLVQAAMALKAMHMLPARAMQFTISEWTATMHLSLPIIALWVPTYSYQLEIAITPFSQFILDDNSKILFGSTLYKSPTYTPVAIQWGRNLTLFLHGSMILI